MTEENGRNRPRALRLAGLVIGMIGVAFALAAACLAFTLGHYAQGISTLGAGLVFGTIFIGQFIRQRRRDRK